ncbi:MAG: ABC transporter substrate-binding protein [Pseudolabrys sp.]
MALDQKLIEKHAAKLGINPKVTFAYTSGGGTINDALLSGSADVAPVGAPLLIYLWDKTRGPQAIKGIMSLIDSPTILFTIDPKIKSLKDYTANDRIAMTTVKISSFAIMLQMAAAKEFGWEQRFKFDAISVAMAGPDSTAAMLNGGTEIKSAVELVPFNVELLDAPHVRKIISSDEVLGGHGTLTMLATTERFHSGRPKSYAAVKAAYEEAVEFINKNAHATAEIYLKWEPNKKGVKWVENILNNKELVTYTKDPHGFGTLSEFIYKLGTLKNKPNSWKDFFFDDGAGLDGN